VVLQAVAAVMNAEASKEERKKRQMESRLENRLKSGDISGYTT
jgi:hypothetical protein